VAAEHQPAIAARPYGAFEFILRAGEANGAFRACRNDVSAALHLGPHRFGERPARSHYLNSHARGIFADWGEAGALPPLKT